LIGCIGPVTAETARSYGLDVAVQPRTYTVPAFVDAIVQFFTTAAPHRAATHSAPDAS
jgi:uroporphyrinogen-III synthase